MNWVVAGLQLVGTVVLTVLGLLLVAGAVMDVREHTTGRRTSKGRRRLNLVTEVRVITRMIHDEKGEQRKRRLVIDGKRVDASISRPPLSPISTPMAREVASWHGLVHLHRPMDTKIGNYPLAFHSLRKADPQ